MSAIVFDDTPCFLGEGPLWHPMRGELYWFDIRNKRLHARQDGQTRTWQFDEHVSAAGWIDPTRFLIASETKLFAFDIDGGTSELVAPLEQDNPQTRSNDGRADPWGGFWIGTMAKTADQKVGSIYRYYQGEVRTLHEGLYIPNAICFDAVRACAYFADTKEAKVWRQSLRDADGWPAGESEVFLDLSGEGLAPDGAVIDALGNLWNAQWGAGRVACHDPGGTFLDAVLVGGIHSSCPAFGGSDLSDLYCTTARQGLSKETLDRAPENGMTFVASNIGQGLPEPRVIL